MNRNKTISIDDLKRSACADRNKHLFADQPVKKKRSKYGAEPVIIDGHRFMSKKEFRRYIELRYKLNLHLISDLRLQVPYELNEGGTHSMKYLADFVYIDNETMQEIVEDAKGYRTKEYKKKKRLMLQIYNIKIKEV